MLNVYLLVLLPIALLLGEKMKEKEKLERHGSISSTASNKSTGTSSSSAAGSGSPPKHEQTWVHEIFEGTLTNETRCLSCETVSPCTIRYILVFHTSLSLCKLLDDL